jgi:hypothetical protein
MYAAADRRPATNTLERLQIIQAENRHRAPELGEQLLQVRTSSKCWTSATAFCGLPVKRRAADRWLAARHPSLARAGRAQDRGAAL